MANWELTSPGWLWLLPILVGLWLAGRYTGATTDQDGLASAVGFSRLRFFHPLISLVSNSTHTGHRDTLHAFFYLVVFSCLIIAMTGPVRVGKQLPDPPRERDIIFIVDTSVSMVLRDYVLDGQRIDRQTLLKGMLRQFTEHLQGERLSIIVFGDKAYSLCPLTTDTSLIREMINRITPTMVGRSSALGDAIAIAVRQAEQYTGRQQVLILLTAANRSTGVISPASAASLAKRASLPLYTIAIGASSSEAEEQRVSGLIYEPADIQLLTDLANMTGALSYQAGDSNALQDSIAEIERRAFNTGTAIPRYYRETLYHWPLLLALSVFSLMQLFNLARSRY